MPDDEEPRMKILLTGGTGGLGRELVRAAEAAGHTVRVGSRGAAPADLPAGREWARMDVASGEGVREALAGADAVIHAASDPKHHAAVDVQGTRRLIEAAREAGNGHFVYVSIVGIDQVPFAYYRSKLRAERIVAESGVPYSLLRATQFHSLVDGLLSGLARVPLVMPVPTKFRVQSVDTSETAERLVRAVREGPGGRLPDFGGPRVQTFGEMAPPWKAARGVSKRTVHLPLPGALAAAFRAGRTTLTDGDRGTVTWEAWLRGSISRG
jgi:uncharacterized protein YbjT (DUF2867 family)